MFGYLNEQTVMGNIGDNPETNTTKDGKTFVRFRVATSRFWLEKNDGKKDERKSETEWHNVIAFGLNAKIASQLKKGEKVYLRGRAHNYIVDGDNGEKKYFHEIVLDNFSQPMEILNRKTSNEVAENEQKQIEQDVLQATEQDENDVVDDVRSGEL